MPFFSTSTVTNTRAVGTAASTIVVNARNLDSTINALVIVQIFASVDASKFYTAYKTSFSVPANSYAVKSFNIAGNVAYEVQIQTSFAGPDTTPFLLSVYGLDESGNLVTNQGFDQTELSVIPNLSPVML